jgi:YidC/Oxa1 family membrane protein insertase
MMNKNTIIGLLLIFGILIAFSVLNPPAKKEESKDNKKDTTEIQQDSTEIISVSDGVAAQDTTASNEDATTQARGSDLEDTEANMPNVMRDEYEEGLKTMYGSFSKSVDGDYKEIVLVSDKMNMWISNKGGRIQSVRLNEYQTFDSLPLMLWNKDSSIFDLTFLSENRTLNTENFYFQAYLNDEPFVGDSIIVEGEDSIRFAMRLYPALNDSVRSHSSYLEFEYVLKGNDYMLDFNIRFVKMAEYVTLNTNYVELTWAQRLHQQEKSKKVENQNTSVYYKFKDDEDVDVDYLSETKDDEEDIKSPLEWVSFKQQFFSATLIAKDKMNSASLQTQEIDDDKSRDLKNLEAVINLPVEVSDNCTIPMSFYFGPNKYKTMRAYGLNLERQIPLGWSFFVMGWINRFAVIPVFNYLEAHIGSYGLIILILTILLKLILLPIAYKTYMSSAKMRVLKPEIDEIGKKFPKKEDSMKKQQATMALYKKAGASPMAGCVPMLLQFPILIAMFRFFPSSIELRQQSFLWATDLSSYDSILELGFSIPFYGDHVSLFTLLMTVSTIIYTKVNMANQATGSQMPGMKVMMYMMPVMFLGIFNSYASGLSYYYFLANMITFLQMFIIRKFVDEDKLRAKIQLNQKKAGPVKKSKFQKRMEDLAKQRGVNKR